MKIVGKLRLILVPLIISIITLIGILPYSFFIKNIGDIRVYKDDGNIFYPSMVISILMLLLIIFIFYRIITRTLIISIDENKKLITFCYPFRYLKRHYRFEEVLSFSFSFWRTRTCDFKQLNFKTEDHIYKITDFEISNFRVLEQSAIKNFKLSSGNNFEYLTEMQKSDELNNSIKFDIKQAKSYRISCYMGCGLAILILFNELFVSYGRKIGLGGDLICIIFLIFSVLKIVQANNTIKNFS